MDLPDVQLLCRNVEWTVRKVLAGEGGGSEGLAVTRVQGCRVGAGAELWTAFPSLDKGMGLPIPSERLRCPARDLLETSQAWRAAQGVVEWSQAAPVLGT